uniref:Uncharacterized protein n=1 Tax=Vespula pensylvanica TaxID=30213 RepID=A0A834P794_VESPE|nr:hypothetical protein H0235_004322 [Vespula pensylvanica]
MEEEEEEEEEEETLRFLFQGVTPRVQSSKASKTMISTGGDTTIGFPDEVAIFLRAQEAEDKRQFYSVRRRGQPGLGYITPDPLRLLDGSRFPRYLPSRTAFEFDFSSRATDYAAHPYPSYFTL